jgi:hypothetical protein
MYLSMHLGIQYNAITDFWSSCHIYIHICIYVWTQNEHVVNANRVAQHGPRRIDQTKQK